MTSPAVIVIGAGICGTFSAYLLADRGCRVTVIDPARPQGTASAHNPGELNPLHGPGIPGPMGDFALEALALHQAHRRRISALADQDAGLRTVLRYEVAFGAEEIMALEKLQTLYATTAGFDAAWIEPEAFRRIEPAAHPSIRGALRLQGNALVDGRHYTGFVLAAARRLGADLVRAEVRGLRREGGRIRAVRLESGEIEAEAVLLATGAWCGVLSAGLGVHLQVLPVKGELLRVRCQPRSGVRHVPLAVLRRRFPKSLGLLLNTYAAAVDETLCYLNSGTEPELVFHQQGSARTIDNPALIGILRDLSQ